MIDNFHIIVVWEDETSEKVFIPMIPSPEDVIVSPHRVGFVTSRRIDSTNGQITIYANSKNYRTS